MRLNTDLYATPYLSVYQIHTDPPQLGIEFHTEVEETIKLNYVAKFDDIKVVKELRNALNRFVVDYCALEREKARKKPANNTPDNSA